MFLDEKVYVEYLSLVLVIYINSGLWAVFGAYGHWCNCECYVIQLRAWNECCRYALYLAFSPWCWYYIPSFILFKTKMKKNRWR